MSKFLSKTKHRNVASRRTKTERSKKRSSQQKQRKVHPKFKRVFKKPTTENNDITYDNDDSENEAESFQRRSGIPVTLKKSKKPKPAEGKLLKVLNHDTFFFIKNNFYNNTRLRFLMGNNKSIA